MTRAADEALAGRVRDRIASVFTELRSLADRTAMLCETASSTPPSRPSRAVLSQLGDGLQAALTSPKRAIDGIGVATVAGYLADSEYWLEWWRVDAHGALEFVHHTLNPQQDGFYDYAARPWFSAPATTSLPTVTGPYVDAGGTNTYTVTAATPITLHGTTIGVAGADIHVAHLEKLLTTASGSTPRVLMNTDRRIIASTSAHHLPGTLMPHPKTSQPGSALEIQLSPTSSWQLFTLPLEQP